MPPADGDLRQWGPLDANISMLFTELPLLGRPAAAREAGFTAVEVLVAVRPGGARPMPRLARSSGRCGTRVCNSSR